MPDREERHLLSEDLGSGEPNPGLRPKKNTVKSWVEQTAARILRPGRFRFRNFQHHNDYFTIWRIDVFADPAARFG